MLFSIYLMMNGVERFLIEKIRVNTKYDLPFNPTQAELISLALFIGGAYMLYWSKKRSRERN
jgi:prolipoprotein diacylglyceryltransferase